MCGIVAYAGHRPSLPVLLRGLERLEYRGYDSSGVALVDADAVDVFRAVGRVAALRDAVPADAPARCGIAHTRWATHGGVTRDNAHPHTDATGRVAVVHNGIIDNADLLRAELEAAGVVLRSQTDTEVLPHLIAQAYARTREGGRGGDPVAAVRAALARCEGTWGLAVAFADHPGRLVVSRRGSPLVIGVGEGEMFVASDPHALSAWTRRVVFLEDDDIVLVGERLIQARRLDGGRGDVQVQELEVQEGDAELGPWPHFMRKEIHEQPAAVERALRGRLREDHVHLGCMLDRPHLATPSRVTLLACGTSFHASSVGARMVEALAGIPARAELASEFAHRDPLVRRDDLVVAVSQSGETFDTLAALRLAQGKGASGLGVVNVPGSSIARAAGAGIHLHAGPEVSVASTKAFTAQVSCLALLSEALGAAAGVNGARRAAVRAALAAMPEDMRTALARLGDPTRGGLAEAVRWIDAHDYALFIGRGLSWHVAEEGALKLKEIAYVPCDAYAAGEMKHGPIAMLRNGTPVVAVAPNDAHRTAVLANVEECRARGARIILVHTEGDARAEALADVSLALPGTDPLLTPLLTALPLQLLAYATAVKRGCDVDRPRNLAKSVTVA